MTLERSRIFYRKDREQKYFWLTRRIVYWFFQYYVLILNTGNVKADKFVLVFPYIILIALLF